MFPLTDFIDHVTPIWSTVHSFPSPVPTIKILVVHPTEIHLIGQISQLSITVVQQFSEDKKYISHVQLYLVTKVKDIIVNIIYYIYYGCNTNLSYVGNSIFSKFGSNESRHVAVSYANGWNFVLGNFSYLGIKNQICEEGKLVHFKNQ